MVLSLQGQALDSVCCGQAIHDHFVPTGAQDMAVILTDEKMLQPKVQNRVSSE
jgi:hypothetical protein